MQASSLLGCCNLKGVWLKLKFNLKQRIDKQLNNIKMQEVDGSRHQGLAPPAASTGSTLRRRLCSHLLEVQEIYQDMQANHRSQAFHPELQILLNRFARALAEIKSVLKVDWEDSWTSHGQSPSEFLDTRYNYCPDALSLGTRQGMGLKPGTCVNAEESKENTMWGLQSSIMELEENKSQKIGFLQIPMELMICREGPQRITFQDQTERSRLLHEQDSTKNAALDQKFPQNPLIASASKRGQIGQIQVRKVYEVPLIIESVCQFMPLHEYQHVEGQREGISHGKIQGNGCKYCSRGRSGRIEGELSSNQREEKLRQQLKLSVLEFGPLEGLSALQKIEQQKKIQWCPKTSQQGSGEAERLLTPRSGSMNSGKRQSQEKGHSHSHSRTQKESASSSQQEREKGKQGCKHLISSGGKAFQVKAMDNSYGGQSRGSGSADSREKYISELRIPQRHFSSGEEQILSFKEPGIKNSRKRTEYIELREINISLEEERGGLLSQMRQLQSEKQALLGEIRVREREAHKFEELLENQRRQFEQNLEQHEHQMQRLQTKMEGMKEREFDLLENVENWEETKAEKDKELELKERELAELSEELNLLEKQFVKELEKLREEIEAKDQAIEEMGEQILYQRDSQEQFAEALKSENRGYFGEISHLNALLEAKSEEVERLKVDHQEAIGNLDQAYQMGLMGRNRETGACRESDLENKHEAELARKDEIIEDLESDNQKILKELAQSLEKLERDQNVLRQHQCVIDDLREDLSEHQMHINRLKTGGIPMEIHEELANLRVSVQQLTNELAVEREQKKQLNEQLNSKDEKMASVTDGHPAVQKQQYSHCLGDRQLLMDQLGVMSRRKQRGGSLSDGVEREEKARQLTKAIESRKSTQMKEGHEMGREWGRGRESEERRGRESEERRGREGERGRGEGCYFPSSVQNENRRMQLGNKLVPQGAAQSRISIQFCSEEDMEEYCEQLQTVIKKYEKIISGNLSVIGELQHRVEEYLGDAIEKERECDQLMSYLEALEMEMNHILQEKITVEVENKRMKKMIASSERKISAIGSRLIHATSDWLKDQLTQEGRISEQKSQNSTIKLRREE